MLPSPSHFPVVLVGLIVCALDTPRVNAQVAPDLHGLVQPARLVDLAAPLDGVLAEVHVVEGQQVRRGQVLAVLDHRVAAAAVQVAQSTAERTADVERARHELKLAESLLARVTAVRAEQAAAEFEYEEAIAKRDQAHAGLEAARERQREAQFNLQLARAKLEQHFLRAPFDGTVIRVKSVPGSTVTLRDELIAIADSSRLRAELHLPIDLFGRLSVGQSYSLQATEPVAEMIQGELQFVSPVVDIGSRTFRCVFRIENEDGRLPAGFAVSFHLKQPTSPAASDGADRPSRK